ncbi:unnamed protein product, partial [Meganyctiphanes norvegica]
MIETYKILTASRLKRKSNKGGGCVNLQKLFKVKKAYIFFKYMNLKIKVKDFYAYNRLQEIAETTGIHTIILHAIYDQAAAKGILIFDMQELCNFQFKSSSFVSVPLECVHLGHVRLQAHFGYNRTASREQNTQFVYDISNNRNDSIFKEMVAVKSLVQEEMSLFNRSYGDREAQELWSHLQLKIPQFFTGIEVKPSLLHGDLWSGNASQTNDGPVIFDPASFYGHHEYDLAISGMFGGFSRSFWDGYHNVIPKERYWNERHKLYKLFHNLNHWNHFGSGYRGGSLQIMRDLC